MARKDIRILSEEEIQEKMPNKIKTKIIKIYARHRKAYSRYNGVKKEVIL